MSEPRRPVVPPLPRSLADPRPVMAVGTALWLLFTAVTGIRVLLGQSGLTTSLWTGVVGVALGGIGYGIFFLQRRGVRRGGRGQQGLS